MALAFPTSVHHDRQHPEHAAPRRPHLRLIEGGRSAVVADRPSAAVYRRRRIVVAVAAALLVLAVGSVVSSVLGGSTATPATGTYQVGAGESLWQIAGELTPHANRLEVVSLLAEANGGSTVVQAGQRLVVPAEVLTLAG